MKKVYLEPCSMVVRMESEAVLQNYSINGHVSGSLSLEDWDTGAEEDY